MVPSNAIGLTINYSEAIYHQVETFVIPHVVSLMNVIYARA